MKRMTALLLVPIALLVAACGDDDGSPVAQEGTSSSSTGVSASADEFNETDVGFAQRMIPHHQQAVEMAELAGDRAESPEVKDLANRIRAAQDPEIERMTAWMDEWGERTKASMSGMHQGGRPDAEGLDLAQKIIDDQTSEIEEIDGLLAAG